MQTTTAPVTVTRETLSNGQHRYEENGVTHTGKSNRLYTHASVYRRVILDDYDVSLGRVVGSTITFLHAREDLALKGHSVGNGCTRQGKWARVGTVEIQDVTL